MLERRPAPVAVSVRQASFAWCFAATVLFLSDELLVDIGDKDAECVPGVRRLIATASNAIGYLLLVEFLDPRRLRDYASLPVTRVGIGASIMLWLRKGTE